MHLIVFNPIRLSNARAPHLTHSTLVGALPAKQQIENYASINKFAHEINCVCVWAGNAGDFSSRFPQFSTVLIWGREGGVSVCGKGAIN